ncbi:hypothetical protein C8Q73DRAFT_158328 [Cubamyces lactineus]|nr:hypothetical protein C8Q73DRAFT_158328 [Cubamyces lactineus]
MGGKMIIIDHAKFMELFVPAPEHEVEPTERLSSLDFKSVAVTPEADMYKPLMAALNQDWLLPNDRAVATPNRADSTTDSRKKIDGGIYPRDHAPEESQETGWGYIELSIECKMMSGAQQDPFDEDKEDDPEPTAGTRRSILGQIMTYSILVFDNQHRTHHYTLMILGDSARIIRWDRSGVVATKKFNYVKNPLMLARFLWRFARMTPAERGHDTTAVRVLPGSVEYKLMDEYASKIPKATPGQPYVGDHARQLFAKSLVDAPRWKLRVDDAEKGPQYFLVGKADFKAPGLAGRGTRTYVALDINHRTRRTFAYLKDAWRVAHLNIDQEGEILKELNSADKGGPVDFVPTLRCHGDVEAQVTASQDVWEMKYGTQGLECPLKTHRHYRIVVNEVGLPLKEFRNADELVCILILCIKAHGQAYNRKGLIHRDISAGNILIYPKPMRNNAGKVEEVRIALLADWELAKRIDEADEGPRQPDRTGTWQFMSANALAKPTSRIVVQDDIESIFHVLLYEAIRYLPHNCFDVGDFIHEYFDDYKEQGGVYYGGRLKLESMRNGALKTPLSKPLMFYKSEPPVPRPLISKVTSSQRPNVAGGMSAQFALTPVDSIPESPSGPSEDPKSSSVVDPIPHPINDLISDILCPIKAHYRLYVPEEALEERGGSPSADTEPMVQRSNLMNQLIKDDDDEGFIVAPSSSRPEPSSAERVQLVADAAQLASHSAMVKLFNRHTGKAWPKADRVPDKLPKHYHPPNERQIAAGSKRSADLTFPMSDRALKRSCTGGR